MNRVTMGNIGALVSSFFVGSCCLGPTMFVLFGISIGGLNFFTSLERFRPLFILVAFLFLGYAFYHIYLNKPAFDCVYKGISSGRINKVFFWLCLSIFLVAVFYPMVLSRIVS
ncbi:MAG: hypothetical protein A3G93_06265 [Nitrospinae bacterium RIFCSPLOWO2_12_FULL_45_22]|nr:MAG: hypothetical protein A3G93_06265 [Nitrospinae bacterium RIFCSPLOWO2_12_FULL_45_22]